MLAHPSDPVVCDINMPSMNGFELLSLMRRDAETASIPVIPLSGRSDGETIAAAMEPDATDLLTKPLTREDLMKLIHAYLAIGGHKAAELRSA